MMRIHSIGKGIFKKKLTWVRTIKCLRASLLRKFEQEQIRGMKVKREGR